MQTTISFGGSMGWPSYEMLRQLRRSTVDVSVFFALVAIFWIYVIFDGLIARYRSIVRQR
jgi:hypothetical protein